MHMSEGERKVILVLLQVIEENSKRTIRQLLIWRQVICYCLLGFCTETCLQPSYWTTSNFQPAVSRGHRKSSLLLSGLLVAGLLCSMAVPLCPHCPHKSLNQSTACASSPKDLTWAAVGAQQHCSGDGQCSGSHRVAKACSHQASESWSCAKEHWSDKKVQWLDVRHSGWGTTGWSYTGWKTL